MLIRPQITKTTKNTSDFYFWKRVDSKQLDDFINKLNIEKQNIKGKSLYLEAKTISQDKLREAGFSIVRKKDKADLIVIKDLYSYLTTSFSFNSQSNHDNYLASIDCLMLDEKHGTGYKYIFDKDLYKFIYKYEGNKELFENIKELFESNNQDNFKMAMEFMSNANWTNNEIYLQELFNLFYSQIDYSPYKPSISFKGFVNSLDFKWDHVNLDEANDYRELCKTEEHHTWVYKKFEDIFKEELEELVQKHKIKLDKIEFSIDKSIINDNKEE